MHGVSRDVICGLSQIRVISSEHRTCTPSDPSVRVMPGGEACAGFVTVTVESERAAARNCRVCAVLVPRGRLCDRNSADFSALLSNPLPNRLQVILARHAL